MHFPPLTLWGTQHLALHKTVFDKKLNSAAVACGGYTALIDAIVYISSVDNGFHKIPFCYQMFTVTPNFTVTLSPLLSLPMYMPPVGSAFIGFAPFILVLFSR